MERRPFGGSGPEVPVIGLGTWNIEQAAPRVAVRALQQGLDRGMSHIDTAEMYGSGRAEELVGEAIAGRRAEVFLVSKVLPENASAAGTASACEASLRRLGTDYLDCYLLHWRGEIPLEETIGAFQQLQGQGKIRSWGVSNFDVPDLEEALDIAGGPFACNQVLYHLKERAIEHEVLPWCEQHGVALVGYSPFGHGDFPAPGTRGGRVLEQIAERHGCSARQVALRFLVRRPGLFTIPKAANPGHADENARAGELALNDEELALIEQTFRLGSAPASLPML